MASVTAIEFTDLECKILQAERSKGKKPVVRTLVTFPLPKNDDPAARVAARAQMLKDVLKKSKVTAQSVSVIIPKHYVVSRKVTLPSTVDEELAGMARFEAERHIPFNAERHIVGHHVLSRQGVQGSEVLLAAVDLPVAKEYLDVCLGAGLTVETIDVSTFALHRSYAAVTKPASPDQDSGVSAVINIGLAATEIVIIQNGQLAYSRSASVSLARLLEEAGEVDSESHPHVHRLAVIDALEAADQKPPSPPLPPSPSPSSSPAFGQVAPPAAPAQGGGAPLSPETQEQPAAVSALATEAGEEAAPAAADHGLSPAVSGQAHSDSVLRQLFANWRLKLLKEIRTTYEFARREFNCPPIAHFHICGEGVLIRNLPQMLSTSFGIEASVYDPFASVELSDKVEPALQGLRPAHAALVGGIMNDAPAAVNINLLPPQYLEEKTAKRQQQSYMITGILALTALVLAYVWLKGVLDGQVERLEKLRDYNSTMAAAVKELRAKKLRNDIVNTYVRDRKGAVEILDQLSSDTLFSFIPKQVALRSFEFTKDESVKITGYAMSLADANRMRQALEDTGYFVEVRTSDPHNQQTFLPKRDRKTPVYQINLEGIFPKETKKKSSSSSSRSSNDDTGLE